MYVLGGKSLYTAMYISWHRSIIENPYHNFEMVTIRKRYQGGEAGREGLLHLAFETYFMTHFKMVRITTFNLFSVQISEIL